jgi:thiamine-phosphate pyrophosphorylase
MLVTDRSRCGGADGLVAAVEAAVEGGADAVQLREKDLPPGDLLPLAHRLRQATRGRALLLINGPPDVAIAAAADGVHLPDDAPPVQRPQQGFLIGRSVHSLDAARRAEAEGVDYLIAGPVYRTRSHPGREPAGFSLIEEVAGVVRAPVLAIGGVTAGRVEEVVRAGASGIAVISAVLARPDKRFAAGELHNALDAAWIAVGAARP